MRLKPGDSLLMPMRVPHRWSVAQEQHCGAIHRYSPAGLMEMDWSPVAQDTDPKNQEARNAEFEKRGLTLLGGPLSKEEIDGSVSEWARTVTYGGYPTWKIPACEQREKWLPADHFPSANAWTISSLPRWPGSFS
jgi:hypothetical protein